MMRSSRPLLLSSVVAVAALSLLAAGCGRRRLSGGRERGLFHDCRHDHDDDERTARLLPVHALQRRAELPRPAALRRREREADHSPTRTIRGGLECLHSPAPANGGSGSQETAQQQRTQLADELSFARCMRSRGVSRFPDPTAQGGLSVEMVQAAGYRCALSAGSAGRAGVPAGVHGGLTPAKVREALNNAGG